MVFYQPVSVREAVREINETWFLPAVQRPYDWGERTKKQQFIYKLFDSLVRRYPVGTMIIWKTKQSIPYREFLREYDSERMERIKEEGVWEKADKCLIYDGQQRLQSLFSCLRYSFHGEVLCYDLLFDPNKNRNADGFKFFPMNESLDSNYLKLNELFICDSKQRTEFEDKVLERFHELDKETSALVRNNLSNLWTVFVEEDMKLLSYFPLPEGLSQDEVLDVFKRINTTGMQLTNSEILFSDLKGIKFNFEEQVWDACLRMRECTDGLSVSPDFVLQVVHLLVKDAVRVDPARVEKPELHEFINSWSGLESPLTSFYSDFMFGEFKINNDMIFPRNISLTPLIAYFYYMRSKHDVKFKDFSDRSIQNMKKFFIVSQLKDWDLQSYADRFHEEIKTTVEEGGPKTEFPYERLRDIVKDNKKRFVDLETDDLGYKEYRWLVLKIMLPDREYQFSKKKEERYEPEIDHIFPMTPDNNNVPEEYGELTDTVWNMQPIKGQINSYKSNLNPRDFFVKYPKYLEHYDFLPTTDMSSKLWDETNIKSFIGKRKEMMLSHFKKKYELAVSGS